MEPEKFDGGRWPARLAKHRGGHLSMDNLVLGQRLRAHRTAAGWSLRELSKRLNSRVTPQALSQYETGQTCPRSEVLRALARVLGTRVEQLGREPDPVRLGAIQFRHPMTLTPAVLNRAHGRLMTLTERSLALEQRVGCPLAPPSLPFTAEIEHVRTPEDAEGLAQDVRRRWGLGMGPLPHLVSLFEARGIRVFESFQREDDPDFNGCSAFMSYSAGSGLDFPVVLLNRNHWGERKRFTLCHELAHLILPSSMHDLQPENVQERLADWFAGALLLPAARLRDQLGRKRKTLSWYELSEIKEQFGASYQAITYRCQQAGIITRKTFRDLFDNYRRLGWREAPYREHHAFPPERESSTRLARLALRGITEGILSQSEAAMCLNTSEKEFVRWMEPPND